MGREIKRVPVDFDWPLNEVWKGYLSPDRLDGDTCPGCVRPPSYVGQQPHGDGYSRHAQHLHDLWYGYLPFDPETNGSTPFPPDHPTIRQLAERNVGRGEPAIRTEANRLADLFNGRWRHHLNHDDIAALITADRLRDFTHSFDPNRDPRWQPHDPPAVPLPAEVNAWSLSGMGHDSINAHVVIQARCEREGYDYTCSTCDGHGSVEAYPGQRADAEAWERTEPPTGEGWQLWETVSEGSPISAVFATAEELAQWLTTPASCWGATKRPMTIEQARGFVGVGWAPSFIGNAGGLHDGADYVGSQTVLSAHEDD